MITLGFKTLTSKTNPWIIQVYWPQIRITRTEFLVDLSTVIRLTKTGGGFNILGFGMGVLYEKPKV